ncbi:MAG: DNA repair protein RecN, partial [Chloroflexia bacterium]|nr:DNA repair protein RecN [Chloroflexia bacterium]
ARSASIDATFDLAHVASHDALSQFLTDLDLEAPDGVLILSREIHAGGRSSARLNGRPTTAAILAQVGSVLVDIHGQSDHLSVLKSAVQLELLDRFARVTSIRDSFAKSHKALRAARMALEQSVSSARERMQRVDLLRYQIEEISRANLQSNEESELDVERGRLANADRLAREAAGVYAALAGDDETAADRTGLASLRYVAQTLAELRSLDPTIASIAERASELQYLAEDLAGEIRSYRDAVDSDPARLAEVEERFAAIHQLKRKYGTDIQAILDHARAAEAELERLTSTEADAQVLAAREADLNREAGMLAAELSQLRSAAAAELAGEVERAIARLNMGNATFAVTIDRVEDPNGIQVPGGNGAVDGFLADQTGIDRVAFKIAPNAGEELKPLSRIASGGETARLMLALKSILSEVDETPTLVFDEIDVGVGGRSGQVVGETLWGLTTQHQVIVITHLPQIAAFGEVHFQIAKSERDGRVVSIIDKLEGKSRIRELAAMLDGAPVTESSLLNAKEMLERAADAKDVTERRG